MPVLPGPSGNMKTPRSLGKSFLRVEGVVLHTVSSEDTLPPTPTPHTHAPWGELCTNKRTPSQAWWPTPIIPALGALRLQHVFEVRLDYRAVACSPVGLGTNQERC